MTEALQGLGIVVTRPAHQSDALCEMIRAEAGRPIAFPTIEICASELEQESRDLLSDLSAFRALLFVSANAVEYGLKLLDPEQLRALEIIAVGNKTAQRLRDAGLPQVIAPDDGSGSDAVLALEALAEDNIRDQNVLILRGNGGRELIAETLRERGASPHYIEVYQRRCPQTTTNLDDDWNRQALHLIICTSIEGLQNLQSMVGQESQPHLLNTPLLVASERIEDRALELGFKKVMVAANATDEALLDTLINWAQRKSHDTAVRNATMNEEKKPEDAQADEAQVEDVSNDVLVLEGTVDEEKQPAASGGKGKIAWVLIVILILALAGMGYWFKQQYAADQQAQAAKLESSSSALGAVEEQLVALQGKLDALAGADSKLSSSLNETSSHLKALEDMVSVNSRRQANTSSDWIIAEADYLLSIAANRIQMERDVKTALTAVLAADDRLKSLAEPGIIPIRQQLMTEINNLRGVQDVDINGQALYLADLVSRVESLPLKKGVVASKSSPEVVEEQPIEISLENWRPILDDVWKQLKSLVVIRKQAVPDAMLFDPERHYFLYQNLRLELASARLSVLRRDSANMQASLKLVNVWLNEFFNTSAAPVKSIIEALEKMQTLNLTPALPDISASRSAIASYMEQQGAR